MSFSAHTSGITLPSLGDDVRSVDVYFGRDRVWSIDLNVTLPNLSGVFTWPPPIVPYLTGATTVTLKISGENTDLASVTARFTDEDSVTRILNDEGVPLAINKWGRLGKTLEAGNVGVQDRILHNSEILVRQLEEMGLRPFVVGGTLLGAVRSYALLPHDDDADLAYLSEHTNPADVALEGFRVGRKLEALGYEVVRHSATHMQLYFRKESGSLDHYVDVFAAFFTEDGHINQPFHVRGEMTRTQMLPFSQVSIEGRSFPAPQDPHHWLVINYDENWRTPIPGYRINTPRPTIRRFQSWFGSFHFKRDFWNDWYDGYGQNHSHEDSAAADEPWQGGAKWIMAESDRLNAPWLIDLGCGAAVLAAQLADAEPSRQVIAADYSVTALELARERAAQHGFTAAHVNLYRTTSLGLPLSQGIDGPFDIVANHVLSQLGPRALPNALRLIRMALRSGGHAVATLYGEADRAGDPADPPTSGLTASELTRHAAQYGLETDIVKLKPAGHETDRSPYGVRFKLAPHTKEIS